MRYHHIESDLKEALQRFANTKRSADWYDALQALHDINSISRQSLEGNSPKAIALWLVDVLWNYLFLHYFWLQKSRQEPKREAAP
jgi:hypothetical protein